MILTNKRTNIVVQRIQAAVEAGLKERQISARRASIDVVGHDGLIRDIRAGRVPSVDRLEALFEYLGLEHYFGPRRKTDSNMPVQAGFADLKPEFSKTETIPLRGFASCSVQGWGRVQPPETVVPAPIDLSDTEAFYVRAHGQSMVPEGITAGALCLISPSVTPKENDRVWAKEHGGKTSIKRLIALDADTITLCGWMPVVDGQQKSFNEERVRKYTNELYPVTAVYRGNPMKVDSKVSYVPDPRMFDKSSSRDDRVYLHEKQAVPGGKAGGGKGEVLSSLEFPNRWLASKGVSSDKGTLIRVDDDGMGPTLAKGAVVLVNCAQSKLQDQKIFALLDGVDLIVRRVEMLESDTTIISGDNPLLPSRVLTRQLAKSIEVIGEVVWVAQEV